MRVDISLLYTSIKSCLKRAFNCLKKIWLWLKIVDHLVSEDNWAFFLNIIAGKIPLYVLITKKRIQGEADVILN
jgi:hypothetical protein